MQTKYKGFTIDFNERIGKFRASKGSGDNEIEFENEIFNKLKEQIDKIVSKKHVRITVLYEKYSYGDDLRTYKPWIITSYNPETGVMYLSDGKSSREKTNMGDHFVKDTPENRILAANILEKKEKIKVLEDEIKEIEDKKFKTWKEEDLIKVLQGEEVKKTAAKKEGDNVAEQAGSQASS